MKGIKRLTTTWNDYACLSITLTTSLLVALISTHFLPYFRIGEYVGPAMEMVNTGHISYNFLPIGYPALLALGYKTLGSEHGITAVNIALSLVMLASAWVYLRLTGAGIKVTFVLITLLSFYPDFSLSYNKTQDINVTAIALFCCMSSIILVIRVKRRLSYADILLGLSLGAATIIRPNMMLLVPMSWLVLGLSKTPKLFYRSLLHLILAVSVYSAITTVVHGKFFFPRNGPYNLYAGFNPFAAQHLSNEEDSIPQAMAAQGIIIQDWRDPKYDPIYLHSALSFIRHHPTYSLKLVWLRFVEMMLPDFRFHAAASLAGWGKALCALAVPLWLIGACFLPSTREYDPRFLVIAVMVTTVLPFALTVSAQRFREPLDFICWIDLGASILLTQFRQSTATDTVHAFAQDTADGV